MVNIIACFSTSQMNIFVMKRNKIYRLYIIRSLCAKMLMKQILLTNQIRFQPACTRASFSLAYLFSLVD